MKRKKLKRATGIIGNNREAVPKCKNNLVVMALDLDQRQQAEEHPSRVRQLIRQPWGRIAHLHIHPCPLLQRAHDMAIRA